jgi:putative Mg2+ transporter-C (MgtC) family protein
MLDLVSLLHWELMGRVLVAFLLGGVIGVERERRAKVAGLRTHMLVAGGSALFTVASYSIFGGVTNAWDPSRVAAQIVSGIGFLGAGAIIQSGGSVAGLTTAASIWMAAALGMAAGGGAFPLAVVSTIMAVVVLRLPRERLRPRAPQRRAGRAAPSDPSGLFPGQRARPASETLTAALAPLRTRRRPARRRARPAGR